MIGNRIKKIRQAKRMTQAELAIIIKVPRYVISNYERNHSEPDIQALRDLAKALNVSSDFLLGIKNSPGHPPFKNWSPTKRHCFKRDVYLLFGFDIDKEINPT